MKKTPYQIAVEGVAQEIIDNYDSDELRDASDEAGEVFVDDVMEAIAELQKK